MSSCLNLTALRTLSCGALLVGEEIMDMQPLDLRIRPIREKESLNNMTVTNQKPSGSNVASHATHSQRQSPYQRTSKVDPISSKHCILSSILSRTEPNTYTSSPILDPEESPNNKNSIRTSCNLISSTTYFKTPSPIRKSPHILKTPHSSSYSLNKFYDHSNLYNEPHNLYSSRQQDLRENVDNESNETNMDDNPSSLHRVDDYSLTENDFSNNRLAPIRTTENNIKQNYYRLGGGAVNNEQFKDRGITSYYSDEDPETDRKTSQNKCETITHAALLSSYHDYRKYQQCIPDSSTHDNDFVLAHASSRDTCTTPRDHLSPLGHLSLHPVSIDHHSSIDHAPSNDHSVTSSDVSARSLQFPKFHTSTPPLQRAFNPQTNPRRYHSPHHRTNSIILQQLKDSQPNKNNKTNNQHKLYKYQHPIPVDHPSASTLIDNTGSVNRQHVTDMLNSGVNRVNSSTDDLQNGHNSTRLDALDFWITKVLLEECVDVPATRNPGKVDCVYKANGDIRVRVRLVDLIEMQVEQSLKA